VLANEGENGMFHRSTKRILVGIFTALLLLAMPAPAVFASIIIDPAESCRAERDRPDENRRSGTKLVVKGSKKSWIKFDLGALDVDHLETATLMVAAIDDESGNSCDLSVVNDSYTTGIDWTSDDLAWNNAPANDTLSDSALTTDATLVANFAVDGSAGTLFAVDILAALQADTDGIVQFVVHNSTGGQISFAPHDHPEAAWRAFIEATEGTGGQARNPYPASGATDVSLTPILTWTSGEYVGGSSPTHTVFFSEDFNNVNDGIGGIVQSTGSYDPGRLNLDTTYYWRVDEVSGAPDFTVYPGKVWSFTTEPAGYPIANIIATASSSFSGQGPDNTVNGSGLSDDLHSTVTQTMWMSDMAGPQPTWIQFEFDKAYVLHEMWVWNSNTDFETSVGYGARDVTIEHSVNGVDYTTLGTTHEFARAPGAADYAHNTTVDLGGLQAKFVRFTINSNWGGFLPQFGLSEVRFLSIPLRAREPSPDSGAADVPLNVTLAWKAGRQAASHDVYVSPDEQAVIDGTAPVAAASETSHDLSALDLDTVYYWRVDEVNDAETPTTWQGDVWDFTTQEFIVVEDFEDYNDWPPDEIYTTWEDGFVHPANGAQVGNLLPSYAETTIVHGGRQSMPLFYGNTGGATHSEGARTFAAAQDWTKYGVRTLGLWFHGAAGNTGQLYVKINGVKIPYDGEVGNIAIAAWQPWNIDLTSSGVNAQGVTTLAIGIDGNSAAGTLYIDDIRLYAVAPAP